MEYKGILLAVGSVLVVVAIGVGVAGIVSKSLGRSKAGGSK